MANVRSLSSKAEAIIGLVFQVIVCSVRFVLRLYVIVMYLRAVLLLHAEAEFWK